MHQRERWRQVAALLAAAVVLVGCGSPAVEAPAPSVSARVDPVVACTAQLDYWVQASLAPDAPDHGFDYQEMGLSGRSYEALVEILDQARQSPTPVSDAWVHDRTSAACHALQASPRPSSSAGGWPG